jgi:hypothetical protein
MLRKWGFTDGFSAKGPGFLGKLPHDGESLLDGRRRREIGFVPFHLGKRPLAHGPLAAGGDP